MKNKLKIPFHNIVAISLILIVSILLPYGLATCIQAIIDALPEPIVSYNMQIGEPQDNTSLLSLETNEPIYTYNRNDYSIAFSPDESYCAESVKYNEQIYSENGFKFNSGRMKDKYTFSSTIMDGRSIAELTYYDGKVINAMMSANIVNYIYNADNIVVEHKGGNTYKYCYDDYGNLVSKYVNGTLMEQYFYDNGKLSKTLNSTNNFAYEILLDNNNSPVSEKQFLYLNDRFFGMLSTDFGEIPAYVNSNIKYLRDYTYENSAYITEKTIGQKVYEYEYVNDIIVKEYVSENDSIYTIDYIFDANMNRLGFEYNNAYFYYLYDVLGNVLEILDDNGNSVLSYTYDILGKATVSGTNADLANINSYAFRAKDNWYFENATQQYYIGPDVIFNSQYAKTVTLSQLQPEFYVNSNKNTVYRGNLETVCPILQLSISPETELESLVLDRAAEALNRNKVTPIKNVLSFSDETDEITGRTDIYVKDKSVDGDYGTFNAQSYKAVNDESDIKTDIANEFLQETTTGKFFVFDGDTCFIPEQAQLGIKGHFIENNKYVKYYTDLNNPGLINYVICEKENYDESFGNLYDYDNEKFILYFRSTLNSGDMMRVENLTDIIDYDAIRAEIEAEINVSPQDAYSVSEIQIFYISEEYINSLYNGQRENLYLGGRTAQQMYEDFGDDWSFTMYNGELLHSSQVPQDIQPANEAFNWGNFFKKIAIGVGCILVAAVITTVTAGAGLACFAATAATLTGLSAVGGVVGGTIKAVETNSWEGFGEGFAEGFEVAAITSSIVQTGSALIGSPIVSFCFPEGTPVMTALGGTKPIEAIAAGDMVLSYNELTGAIGANCVAGTFTNTTDVLVQITLGGEIIEATPKHPFYVKDAGWRFAGDLKHGDKVLLSDDSESIIENINLKYLDSEITVYNFEVANDHTYFVGNAGVLVHNACAAGAGALSGNSAGLTANELAELLGLGTAAVGGGIAGTIIGQGIDSGSISLPGANVIEESSKTRQGKISIAIEKYKIKYPNQTIIIRWSTDSYTVLTPRIDDLTGLSFELFTPANLYKYAAHSAAVISTMEIINSTGILNAIVDNGIHVSVFPLAGDLLSWIDSRPTAESNPHPYTVLIKELVERI